MIKMIRREDGFAEFTDGKYSIAIDGAYKVREKIGVVAEAFVIKGKAKGDVAAEVGKAISEAGE